MWIYKKFVRKLLAKNQSKKIENTKINSWITQTRSRKGGDVYHKIRGRNFNDGKIRGWAYEKVTTNT